MTGISSKMLMEHSRTLEQVEIIYRHQQLSVLPQGFNGLTKEGRELTTVLDQLNALAYQWQDQANKKKKPGSRMKNMKDMKRNPEASCLSAPV